MIEPGDDTPWGKAQHVKPLAEGIVNIDTARHGGIKLSGSRNAQIYEPLRRRGGWYEEDCEWTIVAAYFPELFVDSVVNVATVDEARDRAWSSVRDWFPHEYMAITGSQLSEGESFLYDRELFQQRHADDWVVISASGEGETVRVVATRGGTRKPGAEQASFRVSSEEYDRRGRHGFVIDPRRHARIDEPEPSQDDGLTL